MDESNEKTEQIMSRIRAKILVYLLKNVHQFLGQLILHLLSFYITWVF